MRPRQWTKNLLIFGGLIFSSRFTVFSDAVIVILTFVSFCLVSSAGYLVNDIGDASADRLHPEKKERPIPSGRLTKQTAGIAAGLLLLCGFGLAYFADLPYGVELLAVYVANQAFYTAAARNVAILDVFIISNGFLIRAVAGAVVLGVEISPWLLLCSFLLALFLGFAKRKHEYDIGADARASLHGYTKPLLDQLLSITAAAAMLAYCVYAIDSQTAHSHPKLLLTIPFPAFGIFRYLQLVYHGNRGGNPDRELIRDPWLAGTVLLWIAISLYAMYTPAPAIQVDASNFTFGAAT
jgi:4-hydroxybenzoate polyprenyltransferase